MDFPPQARSCAAPWWGRISLIWLLLTPLIVVAYTLLLPLAPNDFWYHARAGAQIAMTGTIPTTALFTTSLPPETPYYYQSWLAQILFFKTLENYGLAGIILLRSACLLAAFILVLCTTWRRITRLNNAGAHPIAQTSLARIAAVSVLAAFALTASNMDVRPQTFSVPLFALFLFCIFEWPFLCRARRIAVAALLALGMVFWANLHGAFFTGLILLGVSFGGEALQALIARRNRNFARLFGNVSIASLWQAALLLFAMGAAALLNPRGMQLYEYVFKLAGDKASQKYIQEWQAPRWDDWYGALFFLALTVLVIVAAIHLRRLHAARASSPPSRIPEFGLRFSELLILATLAVMALRDIRSIIWFGLCLAPVLAAMTAQMLLKAQTASPPVEDIPRPAQIVNAVLALFLIAGVLPLLPQWRTALPLPPEFFVNFAPTPRGAFPTGFQNDSPFLLERNTPVEAVEYLTAHPPQGKIWNDFVFGSYLTWATLTEPRLAPYADPRVEMRPLSFWDEYGRISEGAPDAAGFLKTHGFSDALLDTREQPKLIEKLKAAGWRVILAPNRRRQKTAILLRQPSTSISPMAN